MKKRMVTDDAILDVANIEICTKIITYPRGYDNPIFGLNIIRYSGASEIFIECENKEKRDELFKSIMKKTKEVF